MALRFFSGLLIALAGLSFARGSNPRLITYDTRPLGSADAPLVLRTYFPDPDLDETVLSHHHHAARSPKYSPVKGEDVTGVYEPIKGIPAAIGVNHGPELSYVFDTTEARLLYAWQGGFVDMYPYWGDREGGNRLAFDYLPRLVGTLFYRAAGRHPLEIDGRSVSDLAAPPRFLGYDLVHNQPVFLLRYGEHTVRMRVQSVGGAGLSLRLEIRVEPAARLAYRSEDARFTLQQEQAADGLLTVTISGAALGSFEGHPRKSGLTTASAAAGELLYRNYGCISCHSIDGSPSHGPSYARLFGSERPLADGSVVKADEAYLLESIKTPNAKIARGFPANFMPAYPLQDIECESLVLFIKSLQQPE